MPLVKSDNKRDLNLINKSVYMCITWWAWKEVKREQVRISEYRNIRLIASFLTLYNAVFHDIYFLKKIMNNNEQIKELEISFYAFIFKEEGK